MYIQRHCGDDGKDTELKIWCENGIDALYMLIYVAYKPTRLYSLVVETFNPEKNGREAYFTPLEAPFFIE